MFSLVDRLLFRPPALMVDPSTVHRVYMYRTVQGKESGDRRAVRALCGPGQMVHRVLADGRGQAQGRLPSAWDEGTRSGTSRS